MRRNALYFPVFLGIIIAIGACRATRTDVDRAALAAPGFDAPPAAESSLPDDPYLAYSSPTPADEPAEITESAFPTDTATAKSRHYHTVVKKDTLFGLARTYYGDASRWRDIFKANAEIIRDPDKIRIGDRLLIP